MTNIVWVVTSSYNDYDQNGDYLICVFTKFPSLKDIIKLNLNVVVEHLLKGGVRVLDEYTWYHLKSLSSGEIYKND